MTRHLSNEDFVAVLDGTISAEHAAHLSACESCASQRADFEQVLRAVSTDAVPEPSPLFWNHFSDRVRQATTGAEPQPTRAIWWTWRPVGALVALAGAVALVAVLRAPVEPATGTLAGGTGAAISDSTGDQSWDAVAQMSAALSADDVRRVVAGVPETATSIDDLTPAEQQAFVRLLRAEMGERQ